MATHQPRCWRATSRLRSCPLQSAAGCVAEGLAGIAAVQRHGKAFAQKAETDVTKDEDADDQRVAGMPPFFTLSINMTLSR